MFVKLQGFNGLYGLRGWDIFSPTQQRQKASFNGLYGLRGWDFEEYIMSNTNGFNGLYGLRGWDIHVHELARRSSFNGLYGLRGWDIFFCFTGETYVSTAFMA